MEANQYRTSGVIDESTYREISRFSLSRRRVWLTRAFAVVMALLAVLELAVESYLFAALFLVFTILFALEPMLIAKFYLRTTRKRMAEAYPDGRMTIETFFTEEGVALHNLTTGGQGVLSYGAIRRAMETEHYFYLNTKANQFTLVFKDMLTPEQRKDFPAFLKGKCPDVKVVCLK